jgi:eukaryotic-like serine/threonine-protein kinase
MTGGGAAVRVGELVGAKYRIVRLLAQGGMGVVYEAQHTVVRRRFAVKFLRRDLAERRDILTRFHHEAEAAGALESENVAAAVDFGIAEDGTPYIVMEYLVGESLNALLEREGRLPIARAADLVAQAARGIQVAHAAGIIHRDLKPQNLFVCRRQDGTDLLKVLDFGVAKLQAADDMNAATRTGAMVGTVAYMSPEQARGDKIVDARSDVYALGAIAYELCAGRKPHPGESHNAILHHIATQPAVPLESVAPELPTDFVAIVARALAADPAARPASAGALVEALAPFARREVWPAPKLDDSAAARLSSSQPSPIAEARGSAGVAGSAPRARSRFRPGRVLAIVGAAVAAIAAILVTGVARQRPIQATYSTDTPGPNPSLSSGARPPMPAGAALTSNVVAASQATTPPSPLRGAGGSGAVRPARRHGARPTPTSAAPSSAVPVAPGARPSVAPIGFDPQNPYE